MPESYDCIVIGSGPGGYVAAIRAAQLGMKTAVVEKDVIGGRCLNYACIPAKAVLRVADIVSEIDDSAEFGITVPERTIDFSAVGDRRRKVIKTLTGGVGGLMKKNKIDVIEGLGAVTKDANVRVGDTLYEAKHVVLATGSVPKPVPGTSFGGRVIGTEEAWALEELPKSLAVIGAGASGVEIASAYGRLGTQVLLFEALDRVVPTEDAAGLETHPLEYIDIPRATFCTPNVASFGLTEEQAREQGIDVVVGKLQYGAVGAGTVYGDRSGIVKIIGDKKYGELIGGHIVGAKAVDLIQELVNAKALEGGYAEVARIVHGHPTFSEAVMEAARAADGWLVHG
jgi:pyruvate/2-oxoglutarate dehydrogenase complex dihydrolipoamide dehydrogenase (E3) component